MKEKFFLHESDTMMNLEFFSFRIFKNKKFEKAQHFLISGKFKNAAHQFTQLINFMSVTSINQHTCVLFFKTKFEIDYKKMLRNLTNLAQKSLYLISKKG